MLFLTKTLFSGSGMMPLIHSSYPGRLLTNKRKSFAEWGKWELHPAVSGGKIGGRKLSDGRYFHEL